MLAADKMELANKIHEVIGDDVHTMCDDAAKLLSVNPKILWVHTMASIMTLIEQGKLMIIQREEVKQ